MIFSFKNGAPHVRRALYRKIYGYSAAGRKFPGLLSECSGLKLGAGAIIVASSCRKKVEDVLQKLGIAFSILPVHGSGQLLNNSNNSNNNRKVVIKP